MEENKKNIIISIGFVMILIIVFIANIDQFVKRDDLRKIKTFFNFGIYRQKDNNRLIVKDDMIYKIEYQLNKEAIQKTSKKLGEIKNEYLKEMKVYYSIIPDKSYFLEDDYLKMDYCEMKKIIDSNLKNSKYINICEELAKEDYYKTDIHWKQENLKKIVNKIEK